jgi:hypothetical protein
MPVHTVPHIFLEESLAHVLLASCETVKDNIRCIVGKKMVAPDHFLLRWAIYASTNL